MPASSRWSSSASPIARCGSAPQVRQRRGQVPVRAEDVRAEVADQGVLAGRRHQVEHAEPGADARPLARCRRRRGSGRCAARQAVTWSVAATRHWPSMRRWLCSVTPESSRCSTCLPRATTSVVVAPRRSTVARDGPAQVADGRRRARPAPGAAGGRCATRCRPQARRAADRELVAAGGAAGAGRLRLTRSTMLRPCHIPPTPGGRAADGGCPAWPAAAVAAQRDGRPPVAARCAVAPDSGARCGHPTVTFLRVHARRPSSEPRWIRWVRGQRRRRSPRGVAWNPASASAAARGWSEPRTAPPSAFSTVSLPRAPSRTASASASAAACSGSRVVGPGQQRLAAPLDVERPARRRRARPARRPCGPGWWPAASPRARARAARHRRRSPGRRRPGQRRAVARLAGSRPRQDDRGGAAAARRRRRPPSGSGRLWPAAGRPRRSCANWAAPRPSTK